MPESTEPAKPAREPLPKWFLWLVVASLMISPALVMLTLIYGVVVPVFSATFLGLGMSLSAYAYLDAIGAVRHRRNPFSDAPPQPEVKGPAWAWGMMIGGFVMFVAGVACLRPLGINIPIDYFKRSSGHSTSMTEPREQVAE